MYRQQKADSANSVQIFNSKFLYVENLKLSHQNIQNYSGPRLSKRRNSHPFYVFLNESGVSKYKELGWTGAICLIWRTQCNIIY